MFFGLLFNINKKMFGVYPVVTTENLYDIGLVKNVKSGIPIEVWSRYDQRYGGEKQYGGVTTVVWYDTGIKMTVEEWKYLSVKTRDASGFYQYWKDRLKRTRRINKIGEDRNNGKKY